MLSKINQVILPRTIGGSVLIKKVRVATQVEFYVD